MAAVWPVWAAVAAATVGVSALGEATINSGVSARAAGPMADAYKEAKLTAPSQSTSKVQDDPHQEGKTRLSPMTEEYHRAVESAVYKSAHLQHAGAVQQGSLPDSPRPALQNEVTSTFAIGADGTIVDASEQWREISPQPVLPGHEVAQEENHELFHRKHEINVTKVSVDGATAPDAYFTFDDKEADRVFGTDAAFKTADWHNRSFGALRNGRDQGRVTVWRQSSKCKNCGQWQGGDSHALDSWLASNKIRLVSDLAGEGLHVGASRRRTHLLVLKGNPTNGPSGSYGNEKAVDGDTNAGGLPWSRCGQFSGTTANPAWWGVDLSGTYFVAKVKLYNRNDCCPDRLQDVDIWLGSIWPNYDKNYLVATDVDVAQTVPKEVEIDWVGRYLYLVRKAVKLTVCEIQVWVHERDQEVHGVLKLPLTGHETKGNAGGYGYEKPIDGDGLPSSGGLAWSKCGHYSGGTAAPAWWGVDLGSSLAVSSVKLYNRNDAHPDRLTGLNLYLGEDWADYKKNVKVAQYVDVAQNTPLSVGIEATGQYLTVEKGTVKFTLCEIEVFLNLNAGAMWLDLHGKVTTQSSVHGGSGSEKAIDGNLDAEYGHGSCTHTTKMTGPWWEVELGATREIKALSVVNRGDCCETRLNNFYAKVDDFVCASTVDIGKGERIVVPCHATGSKVRIYKTGNDYFHVCEAGVLAVVDAPWRKSGMKQVCNDPLSVRKYHGMVTSLDACQQKCLDEEDCVAIYGGNNGDWTGLAKPCWTFPDFCEPVAHENPYQVFFRPVTEISPLLGVLTGNFIRDTTWVELPGEVKTGCKRCYGHIQVNMHCSQATTVAFLASIVSPDSNTDSFKLQIDNEAALTWHTGKVGTFDAVDGNHVFDWSSKPSPEVEVLPGFHRVYFVAREDGIRINNIKFHIGSSSCSLSPGLPTAHAVIHGTTAGSFRKSKGTDFYVEFPKGSAAKDKSLHQQSEVEFGLICSRPANVTFEAEVITPDATSDTIDLVADEADFRWELGTSASWGWSKPSPLVTYDAGMHEVILRGVEDGIKIKHLRLRSGSRFCSFDSALAQVDALRGSLTPQFVRKTDHVELPGALKTGCSGNSCKGEIQFPLICKESAEVTFTAEIISPDGNSDSFKTQVDDSAISTWHTGSFQTWTWSKASTKYSLTAGRHIVKMHGREDAIQVRRFEVQMGADICAFEEMPIEYESTIALHNTKYTRYMMMSAANTVLGSAKIPRTGSFGVTDEFRFKVVDAGKGLYALHNLKYGRFVQMSATNKVEASAAKAANALPETGWEGAEFEAVTAPNGEVAFHCAKHNRFLRMTDDKVDPSDAKAAKDLPDDWEAERFFVVDAEAALGFPKRAGDPPKGSWYLAEAGQTCDAYCNRLGQVCDLEDMRTFVDIRATEKFHLEALEVNNFTADECDKTEMATAAANYPAVPYVKFKGAGNTLCKTFPQDAAKASVMTCSAAPPTDGDARRLCACRPLDKDISWHLAPAGKSCDSACSNFGRICNLPMMMKLAAARTTDVKEVDTLRIAGMAPGQCEHVRNSGDTDILPMIIDHKDCRMYPDSATEVDGMSCAGAEDNRARICACSPSTIVKWHFSTVTNEACYDTCRKNGRECSATAMQQLLAMRAKEESFARLVLEVMNITGFDGSTCKDFMYHDSQNYLLTQDDWGTCFLAPRTHDKEKAFDCYQKYSYGKRFCACV